jgi:hypothetical protein
MFDASHGLSRELFGQILENVNKRFGAVVLSCWLLLLPDWCHQQERLLCSHSKGLGSAVPDTSIRY